VGMGAVFDGLGSDTLLDLGEVVRLIPPAADGVNKANLITIQSRQREVFPIHHPPRRADVRLGVSGGECVIREHPSRYSLATLLILSRVLPTDGDCTPLDDGVGDKPFTITVEGTPFASVRLGQH
jgi:hypothetical protein